MSPMSTKKSRPHRRLTLPNGVKRKCFTKGKCSRAFDVGVEMDNVNEVVEVEEDARQQFPKPSSSIFGES